MRGDPYFVWIGDEHEEFDPVLHRRKDEEIERVVIEAEEDGFLVFELTVRPPGEGLAKPPRKKWGILSRERADGTLQPIGKGRVDVVPLGGDPLRATLRFKCAPSDWEARQVAALQARKSEAHWSDVLVDPARRDDPVELLDGLSCAVTFDPVTHECLLHDILGAGLPVWNVGRRWIDGTLSAESSDPPINEVLVEVSASWTQKRRGWFDASDAVDAAFGGQPNTLTPEDFENRWPRVGDGVGNDSGYVVRSSNLKRVYPEDPLKPLEAGPFQGSSEIYNYVTDANLEAPMARAVTLERAWYEGELSISWSADQARRETVRILIKSGVQDTGLGNGGRRVLRLECQDITVDEITPPWEPGTYYDVGDIVRVGSRNWKRLIAGVSGASWAQDLTMFDMESFPPVLIQRWELQEEDQSPLGGAHKDSFFPTENGMAVLLAAAHRGRAVLAEAMRCSEITVQVLLDDAMDAGLSTGMCVALEFSDGDLAIEGNSIVGKVVAWRAEIAEHDTCELTIRPAAGSGETVSVPSGAVWASQTGEDWDKLALPQLSSAGVTPMATGGIVRVRVINPTDEQVAYLNDNDYSPPDRINPKETDPARLLGDVPTHMVLDLVPLAAADELHCEADIEAAAVFAGPRQIDFGG